MDWTDILGSISGALGPVGSLVGGIFSNSTNKQNNNAALAEQRRQFNISQQWAQDSFKQQLDFNKWAIQQQYANNSALWQKSADWNERMWNQANSYNSPTQQMQRLRAAGLNPYMMLGNGGNIGSASSVTTSPSSSGLGSSPSASVPAGHVPTFIPASNPFNGSMFDTLVNNLFTYRQREADTKLQDANATNTLIRNATENAKALALIDNLKADTHSKETTAALNDIQTKLRQATFSSDVQQHYWDSQNSMQQNAAIISQNASTNLSNIMMRKQIKWLDAEKQATLNYIAAQTYSSFAAGRKSYAEASLAAANTLLANNSPFAQFSPEQAKNYAKSVLDKNHYDALKTYNEVNNVHWQNVSLQKTIRQQGADYWNPFNYLGKMFHGSGGVQFAPTGKGKQNFKFPMNGYK